MRVGAQRRGQVLAACEPRTGIFGQGAHQWGVQVGQVRSGVGEPGRGRVEVTTDDHGGVGVVEGRGSGEQVVGGGGQCVLVGAALKRRVQQQLWGRVAEVRRGHRMGVDKTPRNP
ncbi:hypothetical protein AWC19_10875 [Mycobacterium palustre]|uniref:Uncharacterized protein n=1 Tax=Mycobacterium palustre TaxID=153971 RepID=A0A1X1ZJR4_9MYCO|nr:hypothetical protein AWC19_10875 [Mycobacterium palustre]